MVGDAAVIGRAAIGAEGDVETILVGLEQIVGSENLSGEGNEEMVGRRL